MLAIGVNMLTQDEEQIVAEIDKYLDLMVAVGKIPESIILTPKQYKIMIRLSAKADKGPVYGRKGEIDISKNIYRGVMMISKEKPRRSYRKTDLTSWI